MFGKKDNLDDSEYQADTANQDHDDFGAMREIMISWNDRIELTIDLEGTLGVNWVGVWTYAMTNSDVKYARAPMRMIMKRHSTTQNGMRTLLSHLVG